MFIHLCISVLNSYFKDLAMHWKELELTMLAMHNILSMHYAAFIIIQNVHEHD